MSSSPASSSAPQPFADPTALGLLGLAVACASLLPLAFGAKAAFAPEALRTTAWFCLLFGAGCQLIAGLMSLANRNMLGGTLLTTFSFNWVLNAWSFSELAAGRAPSPAIIYSVDVCFACVFVVMTVACMWAPKGLLVLLLDVDVLYGLRIARELTHAPSLALPIALATAALMAIALYVSFALILATASGRAILPLGTPLLTPLAAAPPAPSLSPDRTQQLPVLRPLRHAA